MARMKMTPQEIWNKIWYASCAEIEIFWIPVMMKWQTDDEKNTRSTRHKNGKGLSAVDAWQITKYYQMIIRGQHLTYEEVIDAKDRLDKYSKQYAANTV